MNLRTAPPREPAPADIDRRTNGDVCWAWIPTGVLSALEMLRDGEPASKQEIADASPLSARTIGDRLKWLAGHGLIRIDSDGHKYAITITPKGALVYDLMTDLATALERDPREVLDTVSGVARERQEAST